ncbi:hypothetical protein KBY82_12035 [Cyanobium sp. AMD-g]|uniref:hypothetical protein n=1 Tax=Cyanobium sp. AMD-g TaxID=2823699 RepID=UPI0020CDB367|nr:hypothetical protein [Cyanobium sp. AMD-g]MCP9931512.1 hypothetical protein [Cyanobium sp. AMD-g]
MTATPALATTTDTASLTVTRFAEGLGFVNSLTQLEDGSVLVTTTDGPNPFDASRPSRLIRLQDADGDGVAEIREQLAVLEGLATSVERVGDLIFVTSTGRLSTTAPSITIWRTGTVTGNHATDPLQLAGKLLFDFPADFLHTTYALAARTSPLDPDSVELYFGVGSQSNSTSTDASLMVDLVSGSPSTLFSGGAMPPDSIQRVLVRDNGSSISVSGLTTIATGLRNAAGMVIGAGGELIFQDNGIDGPAEGGVAGTVKSADELNVVEVSELGLTAPDFGFSEAYTAYELGNDGQPVSIGDQNPAYRAPVVVFTRLPDGSKNEGAVEIAEAPIGFAGAYLNTVFTAFFGGFGSPNDENPVVAADLITGETFHWISPNELRNPMGLLAVPNALYLADSYLSTFSEAGVVYRFTPTNPSSFTSAPAALAVASTAVTMQWGTSTDAITGLSISGGMVNGRMGLSASPQTIRTVPKPVTAGNSAAGFSTDVTLAGLDAATTYAYTVQVGSQSRQGLFQTLPGIAPAVAETTLLGSARADTSYGMLAGPGDSVYLTINNYNQTSASSDANWEVRQIDAAGNTLWTHAVTTAGQDLIYDIVAGSENSLYVGGIRNGNDAFIRRLNANDGLQFRRQNGSLFEDISFVGNGYDLVHSLAAASDGSYVVAVGYTSSSSFQGVASADGNLDAFISLVGLNGGPGWTRLISSGKEDVGMKVVVSQDSSSIYMVGYGQDGNDADAYLRKYDRAGNLVFSREISSSAKDYAQSIALDADGNVVVSVSTDGNLFGLANQGRRDVAVLKFDPSGNLLWSQLHGSSGIEEARDLTIDTNGSIYVSGHTGLDRTAGSPGLGGMATFGDADIFVSKLSASGQKLWTYTAGTPGSDLGYDVVVASSGKLILTGETSGALNGSTTRGGASDVFLISLNPADGEPLNRHPIATFRQSQSITVGAGQLSGQLTSIDPDPLDRAYYSRIGSNPPGFSLQENGQWSFDASDPAFAGIATGQSRTLTVVYRVDDRAAPPQPGLPNGVIRVGVGAGYDHSSIQAAIDSAPVGATISIAPGTYSESLTIAKAVTLLGANQGRSASDPRAPETIIEGFVAITKAAADVTLDGLSFVGHSAGVNMRIESARSRLVNSVITSRAPAGGFGDFAFVRYLPDPNSTEPFSNIVVEDNLFQGIVDFNATPVVLQIDRAENASIMRNVFNNTGGGGNIVLAQNSGSVRVEQNLIVGGGKGVATYNGIFQDLSIKNNTIVATNSSGLELNEGSDLRGGSIDGNLVTGSGVDVTGRGASQGLRYANFFVAGSALLGSGFTVTANNDFSQRSGTVESVIGYSGATSNVGVNRESDVASFSITVSGPPPPPTNTSEVLDPNGSVLLLKESGTNLISINEQGVIAPLRFQGAQLRANQFDGWQILAAETIGATQKEVLWKQLSTGSLHTWSVDSNWNYLASNGIFAPSSSQGQLWQQQFKVDASGQPLTGQPPSPPPPPPPTSTSEVLDPNGNVLLLKESGTNLISINEQGVIAPLRFQGAQLKANQFDDWQILAAETIGATQKEVLWKQLSTGSLHTWSVDSNWNYLASNGIFAPSSSQGQLWQQQFKVDASGQPLTGQPPSPPPPPPPTSTSEVLDPNGSVLLLKESGTNLISINEQGVIAPLRFQGAQLKANQFDGWQILAAETIGATQKEVLWKQLSTGSLHTWSVDSNWNYLASNGIFAPSSSQGQLWQQQFKVDASGQPLTGQPPSPPPPPPPTSTSEVLDPNGSVLLLKESGTNLISINEQGVIAPLRFQGAQLKANQFDDWQILAAETIGATQKEVLWKQLSTGSLHTWSVDSNWNYLASNGIFAPSSSQGQLWQQQFMWMPPVGI